jgi:hypothetical protein
MQMILCYWLRRNMLEDMTDRLIEIRRCYGMEINVEKTKVIGILREPSP